MVIDMRFQSLMRRKGLWGAAGALVAGSIAVFGWRAGVGDSPSGTAVGGGDEALGAAATGRADASPRDHALRFPTGLVQSYAMAEHTRVVTTHGQALVDLSLGGALTLTALRQEPTVLVRGQFTGECSIRAADDALGAGNAELSAASQQAFFLEFAADGSFQRALGDAELPSFVGRMWSALGEYLQVSPSAGETRWEARERDAAGVYVAAYEARTRSELGKRKLRYEGPAAKRAPARTIIRFDAVFVLDDEQRLDALTLYDDTRVDSTGEPLPGFEGITELALKRTGASLSEVGDWLAEAAESVDVTEAARSQDRSARDRARIGGLGLAEIFARLHLLDSAEKEERDRAGKAFLALTSLLRLDPSQLEVVRAHIEQGGPLTDTLLAALRDASTPESQRLLAELAGPDTPLDSEQRMQAARSLSRVPEPSGETVATLRGLQADSEVGTQATYGLGSALHRLQGQDPALAAEVRETLLDELDEAAPGARPALLTALGNAGDPATLDAIQRYVRDESPAVRAAAAQALRRIPGQGADAALAMLCTDSDPDVRYSAADAISERAPSTALVQALSGLALGEPVFRTRARAVNTLARWLPQAPGAAEALRVVAESDPHADLRRTAQLAIERG